MSMFTSKHEDPEDQARRPSGVPLKGKHHLRPPGWSCCRGDLPATDELPKTPLTPEDYDAIRLDE